MSQAYKCDRCGKLFAEKSPIQKINDFTFDRIWLLRGSDYLKPDLCTFCMNDFVQWWKEPYLADITNEAQNS